MSSESSEVKRLSLPPLPSALSRWSSVLLFRAGQEIHEMLESSMRSIGLKVGGGFAVLALLSESGPLSQAEIGRQLLIDRATMVAIIDALEQQGMVQRLRNAHDRRLYDITLTSYGRETLERANELICASEEAYFAPLTLEQREQLATFLRLLLVEDHQVTAHVEEATGE